MVRARRHGRICTNIVGILTRDIGGIVRLDGSYIILHRLTLLRERESWECPIEGERMRRSGCERKAVRQ